MAENEANDAEKGGDAVRKQFCPTLRTEIRACSTPGGPRGFFWVCESRAAVHTPHALRPPRRLAAPMARARKSEKRPGSKAKPSARARRRRADRRRLGRKLPKDERAVARSSGSTRSFSASGSRSSRAAPEPRAHQQDVEGIYFICASCKKVCHNIDDGLVEDPTTEQPLHAVQHRQGAARRQGQDRGRVCGRRFSSTRARAAPQ